MIDLFISTLFSSIFLSCTYSTILTNTNVQDTQIEIKQKVEQIKKAYKKVSSNPYTLKYEQAYFDVFPDSFVLFNNLFGSGSIEKEEIRAEFKPGPLYDSSISFIDAFLNLHIEKARYCNKIINISINGKWDADAVGYFKHGMIVKVKTDINLFCELLSKRSDKEIKSFWYFYFDGYYPPKEVPEDLQKVKEIDSRIFSLMELALKDVQQARKE